MKKLIAILFSVLMLCTLIPFAVVSAADAPTIVAVPDAEEVNAGDEFTVAVSLMNNPGVISAKVKIEYDRDVFELIPYVEYDEDLDEDVDWGVEPATGWAKSKCTGPQPGSGDCLLLFVNGTAKKDVTKELFFTATFKVKDDAVSGTYTFEVVHEDKQFKNYAKEMVIFAAQNGSIKVNGSEPTPPECEHEYEYDCSKVCSKCGEETRPEAEHQYFYACDPVCMICYEMTNPEAAHTMNHVEAKPATCTENGNIEYWYCSACDWVEVAGGVASNLKAVVLPIVHNIEHVAAKAATATENGNIEYWYCKDCGYAWLDELCTKNTNLKAVILPATGEEPTNPKTGDNAIFFVVALVAVATLGVAAVSFKKREN